MLERILIVIVTFAATLMWFFVGLGIHEHQTGATAVAAVVATLTTILLLVIVSVEDNR